MKSEKKQLLLLMVATLLCSITVLVDPNTYVEGAVAAIVLTIFVYLLIKQKK